MCKVSSNNLGRRSSLFGKASELFGGSRQAARICTLYHGLAVDRDLLALLEEHECWHSRNTITGSGVLCMVGVDFCECEDSWNAVLFGKVRVAGCDCLAWTAPVGIEVDNDVCVVGHECV